MDKNSAADKSYFTFFKRPTEGIDLPDRFTFPFYYDPHPLCELAALELQEYISTQTEWVHHFNIEKDNEQGDTGGKMFGVLVVRNQRGQLGYLSAFSGKLANQNLLSQFVPPVFDMLTDGSFFNVGMKELNKINQQIRHLDHSTQVVNFKKKVEQDKLLAQQEIEAAKAQRKKLKDARKEKRKSAILQLSNHDYEQLEKQLIRESQLEKIKVKTLVKDWNLKLSANEEQLKLLLEPIRQLKDQRKQKSAALQQRLFEQYQFLDQTGQIKNLTDIFHKKVPPAGSGECAAPKLLQYAFSHQLQPIAMAEFWWGISPKSEIRNHGQFYPACRGRCEPILKHMLNGIKMDQNPMISATTTGKEVEIVYEDDQILIVNKPHDFLSVPGIHIEDSVQSRISKKRPNLTGPLIVHRLDMSTSGIMLIAKTKEVHQFIQYQFIKRKIKKRYVAVLDGVLKKDAGTIDLPLRVDLEDRPRQLVCYDYGKAARTKWEVVSRSNGQTRIHFYPISGRTHQLRVHAAHASGLNMPIIGDDLYGKKADRLLLHAEEIEFLHPFSKELVYFKIDADF